MSSFIVFGATGGLGEELSRRLVSRDHQVFLGARSKDKLDRLADELRMPSGAVDADDLSTITQAFSDAEESFGQIDGAVNAIGSILLKPAHLTSDHELQQTLQINLVSSFAIVREAARRMQKPGGSIVLVSSAAAGIGMPNHEAIAAAKAGVEGLSRSAAATYASRRIRVNVVAPGLVQTDLTRSIWENESSAAVSRAMHALGRLGTTDDVASCAEWLLNSQNSWVTGQVIGIDGGLANVMPRRRT